MDWKTASGLYAGRLKAALDVQRHALDLLDLATVKSASSFDKEKQALQSLSAPIEKLMSRLQKGEFRIAVVGLEKAGKSTFVNAWLGSDLLPAKPARCTFTTTQIYSVQHDAEQCLETIPKTRDEYRAYQESLQEQAAGPDRSAAQKAENDLQVMKANQETLLEIIAEGPKTYRFNHLDEIKETLKRYVADERFAHAMNEARLYTSKLAAVDGVVFYDVPGLDSGLNKHIEESKAMLADCDAIILVQRLDIDLKAHEQDLIKFGKEGDKFLSLADKLFVFWGQIDRQPSREVLSDNWQQLLNKWKAFDLPTHRIVPGSAGAHLVLQGIPIPQVGSFEQTQQKMELLSGASTLEALKSETGIDKLKQLVQGYLDNERVGLLEKRCSQMVNEILANAQTIYKNVADKFPEDPVEAKREQENQNRIDFHQWWGERWQRIKANVNNNFIEVNAKDCISVEFKQRYESLVQEQMALLPYRQPEARQRLFDSLSDPSFDAARINIEWRRRLYSDVRVMIATMAKNLSSELKKKAFEFIEVLEAELWGSKCVKLRLIEREDSYTQLLEHSLNTLFLRFVRPVAEVLIRAPVGSDTRKNIRSRIGADIELIDNYYNGSEPALQRLCQYANYGVDLLVNEEKRKEILGPKIASVLDLLIQESPFGKIALSVASVVSDSLVVVNDNKQEKLVAEVESDIRVLEYYLISSIFEASGFINFCQQELENLRDSFLDVKQESYWMAIVQNEWHAGNPKLLAELPSHLKSFEFDIETSERLRQLKISLANMGQTACATH